MERQHVTPRRKPLTTTEAAVVAGMNQPAFRREMHRERERGRDYRLPRDQWFDQRTPLYDATAVTAWAKGRQG
jgi:hypothetical protein